MTHFIGAVVVEPHVAVGYTTKHHRGFSPEGYDTQEVSEELGEYLNPVLEKFNENREVPRYVEKTKQQVIDEKRASMAWYKESGLYAEYHADPEGYAAGTTNEKHLAYLRGSADEPGSFLHYFNRTDDEIYADEVEYHEPHELGPNGELLSTYNPDSKWDWWSIGGRWEETYRAKQGMTVADAIVEYRKTATDLENGVLLRPVTNGPFEEPDRKLPWWFPYNLVTPLSAGNEWVQQGRMGWFGVHDDTHSEAEWIELLIRTLEGLDPMSKLVFIDFHI